MQIPELAAKLQSVGFTQKQSRVYVAGLFLGASSVQKIAEQADINRATAYVILDELKGMGLVSESTQGKKTVFITEPPEAIERLLESQKANLETKKTELRDLLPSLKEVSRSAESSDAPVVRFYKGEKGTKAIHTLYLRKSQSKQPIYTLVNVDELEKTLPGLLENSLQQRSKKKISTKILYSTTDEELQLDKDILADSRITQEKVAADITMYNDVLVITTYREKNTIVVENKEIVAAFRQLFELAW